MDYEPFMSAIEHAEREHRKPVAWLFSRAQKRFVMLDEELNRKHYAVDRDSTGITKLLGLPIETVDEQTHEPMLRTDKDGQRRMLGEDGKPFRITGPSEGVMTEKTRWSDALSPMPVPWINHP